MDCTFASTSTATSANATDATLHSNMSSVSDKLERMRSLRKFVYLSLVYLSVQLKLGPEHLATRSGAGGGKLTYIEGWRVINLANEVFGFDGWSSEVKSLEVDFLDQDPDTGRFSMGVTAIVRVSLREGASREDIGYGKADGLKSKGDALDKCKKEAVTDAIKRALRTFGNLLGNCLYDKQYITEIAKMKASKPKFDCNDLYRSKTLADHPLPNGSTNILPPSLTEPAESKFVPSPAPVPQRPPPTRAPPPPRNSLPPQQNPQQQIPVPAPNTASKNPPSIASKRENMPPPPSLARNLPAKQQQPHPKQEPTHPHPQQSMVPSSSTAMAGPPRDTTRTSHPAKPPHERVSPQRPATAQNAYFSEIDDSLLDQMDLDAGSYGTLPSSGEQFKLNLTAAAANARQYQMLSSRSNDPIQLRPGYSIDQSRSAPITKAQLQAQQQQRAAPLGQLPTLALRANVPLAAAPGIDAVAAIGAKAVPEIGEFAGGGFASARGLKRVQPEPAEDEMVADENAGASRGPLTASRPPFQELAMDDKGVVKRPRL